MKATKVARQFLSCEQGTVRTELGTAEGILEDLVGTDYSEVWFGDLATRFGHRRQSQCEKKLRALEALRLPDVGGQQGAFGPDYHSVAAEAGELPTL